MNSTALVFTEEYFKFDYGSSHPMKVSRLKLTYDLMDACKLTKLDNCLYEETRPAKEEAIASFHHIGYVDALRLAGESSVLADLGKYNLGPGDNPPFPGVYEWSRLTSGGTIQCAEIIRGKKANIAFNIAGGLHHAHNNRASGFCYINDPVLGILTLLKDYSRILYIDIDAHHGDGVQEAFYRDKRVMTLSFHQHGRTLFPGTGFSNEIGEEDARGYAVNIPLFPYTDDDIYVDVFSSVVPPLVEAFKPQALVTQLGVDSFHTDPLANLDLTTNGYTEIIQIMKSLKLPWLALGGGGYNMLNVSRAWTLAWAEMNGVILDDELPGSVLAEFQKLGYYRRKLRDDVYSSFGHARREAAGAAQKAVTHIHERVLPLIDVR